MNRLSPRRRIFSAGSRIRRGAVAVKVAIVLPVMIGFLGLVIDSTLLMGRQRAAQNAADSAALAAAMRMLRGANQSTGTTAAAVADANQFLVTYNLPTADPLVLNQNIHIPPSDGPYEGDPSFVEVVVTAPYQTLFMQVLGADPDRTVTARAVAGFEYVTSGEGSIVLDPTAKPGLDVSGGGTLRVKGRVLCNSEGGGVDENGAVVPGTQWAAKGGQPNSETGIFAEDLQIVGGVDTPSNFKHIDPGATGSPLHCRQVPIPDPFAYLETPTSANGVNATYRGTVDVRSTSASFDPAAGITKDANGVVVLPPGIYDSIKITGGVVRLQPGIFVLLGDNSGTALNMTGGDIVGDGVMFYVTGHYGTEQPYDPATGLPDAGDAPDPYGQLPPAKATGQDVFGTVSINSSVKLSPIDTSVHTYTTPGIDVFNGMLFYQRRRNPKGASITGNASDGVLDGTIYAKWANFSISGQGTYGAQFVVGSISVTGQGNVTINYDGDQLGRAPAVFLVE